MASIYKRGKTIWVTYSDALGKRIQRSLNLPVSRDGWIRAKELKSKVEATMVLNPIEFSMQKKSSDKLFSEIFKEFIDAHSGVRKSGTIRNHKLAEKEFTGLLGDVRLSRITPEILTSFRDSQLKKYGEFNTARVLSTLRTVFNWAVDRGYLLRSPVTRSIMIHPSSKPPLIFSDKELSIIFKKSYKIDKRIGDMVKFLASTGFRSNEACNLKWDQIDLSGGLIRHHNEKENRWELYPMDTDIRRLIESLSHDYDPYVFAFRHPSTVSHRFKEIITTMKLHPELNLHCLKKTYVSRLVRAGLSEGDVHKLAHHKSFATTLKYYTVFDTEKLRESLTRARVTTISLHNDSRHIKNA